MALPLACPACGNPCPWTPDRAQRRIRCTCGQVFRMPTSARGEVIPEIAAPVQAAGLASDTDPLDDTAQDLQDPEPQPDVYEVDLPNPDDPGFKEPDAQPPAYDIDDTAQDASPPTQTPGKCPACNSPLRSQAVLCMNCGYHLARGGKIKTRVETDPPPNAAGATPPGDALSEAIPASPPASRTAPGLSDDRVKRALARTAEEENENAARERRFHFQENVLPLILIGAGVLVAVFNAVAVAQRSQNAAFTADELALGLGVTRAQAAADYFVGAGKLLLVQIPCLFAGLLFCASVLGSAFGTLAAVLKKLLALALLGGSFYLSISMGVNILMYGMGGVGGLFTASVAIALFWGVIVLLFDDLEIIEVVILYVAMCVLPFWILFVIQLFTAA